MVHINNDQELYEVIQECRLAMENVATLQKITICYNLLEGILRVCSIRMKKEDVLALLADYHKGVKKEVKEMFEDI